MGSPEPQAARSPAQTVDEITRAVIGTKGFTFSDGAWTTRKRQSEAETLVRTSVNHVATQSREELYKANDDLSQYLLARCLLI